MRKIIYWFIDKIKIALLIFKLPYKPIERKIYEKFCDHNYFPTSTLPDCKFIETCDYCGKTRISSWIR